jgi:hypothetical protein
VVTTAAKHVLDQALALPADELRRVAQALLDALPLETAEELEADWLEEARRRAGRLERGEETALDGEETLAALEAKYRSKRAT